MPLRKIYSIDDADALTKSAFSIIGEYHPSAYLLLPSQKKVQKVHEFKRFGIFSLATASSMLEAGKEKEALFRKLHVRAWAFFPRQVVWALL